MNKNFDYKNLTPFKWYVLENFPFIEADFDAITDWQLFCKLGKELNKVINSVNVLGNQVESLTDYVSNYFDNLDVQEEINNKLNEMTESGELEEIITAYLNVKGMLSFDTVTAMKQATNLIDGSFVKTYGYTTLNDKGGAFYKVREVTNQDTVDEELLIALQDTNLVAELVIEDSLVPEQIGAVGDGTTDTTEKFNHAMNIATNYKVPLQLVGRYKINNTIDFRTGVLVIRGSKAQVPTLIDEVSSNSSNLIFGENGKIEINGVANITFENIAMTGVAKGTGKAIVLKSFKNKIINCSFNAFDIAISTEQGTNWTGENQIVNCNFIAVNKCIVLNNGSDGDINGCLVPANCNYFITGGFDAGFKIENNHDYSKYGSEINGYNTNFIGNYVDGWNKLKIAGNSGFNIVGNVFIGTINPEDTNIKYAIKFTNTDTISSGNITGNIMATSNNNTSYDYLVFIDITDVQYFSNVIISGNNCRIVKKMFKGSSDTKLFYTEIDQLTKAGSVEIVNSRATLNTENITMQGNLIIAHTTYNLNNLQTTEVARLSNLTGTWLHIIKMNNSSAPVIRIGNRSIYAQDNFAAATSMEVISIGIRDIVSGGLPNIY